MLYVPKLGGYRADSTMADAASHAAQDLKFADNLAKFDKAGASVSSPGVETNGVLDLRQWASPVEDQGQAGSCVANATVGSLEFLQIRNGQPFVNLSRLFIYYNARLMMQEQTVDDGCIIRIAMGTLSSLGTCTEDKWPYDLSKLFVRPSWGSYRIGYANKIESFYSIDGTGQTRIDLIKRALRAQHPVVFGMNADQGLMNVGGDGIVPRFNGVSKGGHATLLVGYDENRRLFIGRNSWGVSWGLNGYYLIGYDDLDARSASDFWVPFLPGTSAING